MPGAVYLPFLGDSDIAEELYTDRQIFGADVDAARVTTARTRLLGADIRQANCDIWPFPDVQEPFAVADLDAYANPYPALVAFWVSAQKAERVVIFGTDGERQTIKRRGVVIVLPECKVVLEDRAAARAQFNSWWSDYVLPFCMATVQPWVIVRHSIYLRKDMLHWAIVVEPPASETRKSPRNPESSAEAVEHALYTAAVSGNVRAIELWLDRHRQGTDGHDGVGDEQPLGAMMCRMARDGRW